MRYGLCAWVAALAMALAGTANAGAWPDPITVGDGSSTTITITPGRLGAAKTASKDNTGTGDRTGALALRILPTDGEVLTINADNLDVAGYTSTITAKSGGAGNAYGPLQILGLSLHPGGNGGGKGVLDTNFANVSFRLNNTTFIVDSAHAGIAPSAFGGAADFASAGTLTYAGGIVDGNTLTATINSGATIAHVNGGGISIRDQFTAAHYLTDLDFTNNAVLLESANSATGGAARGGALFVQNTNDESALGTAAGSVINDGTTLYVKNAGFENNVAANTLSGGNAYGGAAAFDIAVKGEFSNSTFTGNAAIATGSGGTALGGALHLGLGNSLADPAAVDSPSSYGGRASPLGFISDPRSTGGWDYHTGITDTTFTNNYARGENAQGGAIWTASSIAMSGVTFQGNYTVGADGVTGRLDNAIHLAAGKSHGSDYDQLYGNDAITRLIFTDGTGSASYDYDGISSETASSGIIKVGNGDLHLYGRYDDFKGFMGLIGGVTYFKGGQTVATDITSSGTLYLYSGAAASLAKSAAGAGNVTFGFIDFANTGGALIARAYDGSTGAIGNSNHFVSTNPLSYNPTNVKNPNNVFKIHGDLEEGKKYYIVEVNHYGIGAATLHSTVGGLYSDYGVYVDDSSGAVWAEAAEATRTLASYAGGGNAASFAGYLNSVGGELKTYIEDNYDASNAGTINHLLTLGSGEGHASGISSAASYGFFAANNFATQALGGWTGADSVAPQRPAPLPLAPRGAYGSLRNRNNRFNYNGHGVRIWGHFDGFRQSSESGDAHKAKTNGWNISFGADKVIGDWLVGGGIQYGDNRLKVGGLGAKNDYDAISFALYGGRRFCLNPGTLYLNGGMMLSSYDFESRRHDGLGGRYTADYSGFGLATFLDAGFGMRIGRAAEIQPFANLTWSSFWNEDFTEAREGGVGNPLRIDSDHQGNLFSTLGIRGKVDFGRIVGLDGNIGWRHTFGKDTPTTRVGFHGAGGSYLIRSAALDRDQLVFGVGLNVRPTQNTAIRVGYDGSVGNDSWSHRGSVDFALSF